MASSQSKHTISSFTPLSDRYKRTADTSQAHSSKTELDTAAKKDAERLAEEKIRFDPDVLTMAYPWDETAKNVSAKSAELVTKALESFLPLSAASEVLTLPPELNEPVLSKRLTLLANAFKPWLLPLGDTAADKFSKEKPIYSYFRDVVLFVMVCLKTLHAGSDVPENYRLLLPNGTGGDSKGKDSTQGFKVDQVLVLRPWSDEIGQGVKEWRYANILAVAEAKVPDNVPTVKKKSSPPGFNFPSSVDVPPPTNLKAAQGQMLCYSRHIYESQHNRLLIWGLTFCGSLARVYNSGPDCTLSSADLDMREASGRRQFVEWLVYMSLGEDEQRGFNPAVQLVDSEMRGKYWKIDVPEIVDEGYHSGYTDHATMSYYSRGPTVVAGSSFGRNTRGFPATKDINSIDRPDVFVKTAWQHAERGPNSTRLSELDCLKLIKKEFDDGKDGINVPILVAGGVMAKRRSDGSFVPLTTDAFYVGNILERHEVVGSSATIGDGLVQQPGLHSANDDERNPLLDRPLSKLVAFRQQYALVTDKICEPLNTVKTADELIIVLYDAMRAHSWVLENCSLVHRDISPNNIMRVARPERTGTKPFMSVPNLEGHPEQRTEFDDWESLLYVLCWIATFGINADDRNILAEVHKKHKVTLEISEWHTSNNIVAIATKKRNHLHGLDLFTTNIVACFPIPREDDELPDYRPLQHLAIDLYNAMFQHPKVDEGCRGALKRVDDFDYSDDYDDYDSSSDDDNSSKVGGTLPLFKNMTMEPSGSTDNPAKPMSNDPFINRMEFSAKTKIIKGLKRKLEKHAGLVKARPAAASPK
ncbi:hypothetical protein GGI19_001339 [Coemansia pectinata]|uniref:Fungal-type protein kinase domain-containing protein n=1 Tax=Coemansia pectinata TaxID=1052879 RepID=A0A9W8GXX4_9FUNG|nr:hypothetical protein GGI19_001339 [Coemansia pectinata]